LFVIQRAFMGPSVLGIGGLVLSLAGFLAGYRLVTRGRARIAGNFIVGALIRSICLDAVAVLLRAAPEIPAT
jgi:hypothetical protein